MSEKYDLAWLLNPDGVERTREVSTSLPFHPLFRAYAHEVRGEGFTVPSLSRRPVPSHPIQRVQVFGIRKIPSPFGMSGTQSFPTSAPQREKVEVYATRPFARATRTSRYWHDAGWEERPGALIGHYRANEEKYPGCVLLRDSLFRPWEFYIYGPPKQLLEGTHGACFYYRGGKGEEAKYWVHWSEPPADIDAGIMQIERNLVEALGGAR
jgi:hypothetical protein